MAVITGTTPLTYTPSDPALTWDASQLDTTIKFIAILNTGVNTMEYKMLVKADANGTSIQEFTGKIDPGSSEEITLESPKDWLSIDVVASDGANATTFEIQTNYI